MVPKAPMQVSGEATAAAGLLSIGGTKAAVPTVVSTGAALPPPPNMPRVATTLAQRTATNTADLAILQGFIPLDGPVPEVHDHFFDQDANLVGFLGDALDDLAYDANLVPQQHPTSWTPAAGQVVPVAPAYAVAPTVQTNVAASVPTSIVPTIPTTVVLTNAANAPTSTATVADLPDVVNVQDGAASQNVYLKESQTAPALVPTYPLAVGGSGGDGFGSVASIQAVSAAANTRHVSKGKQLPRATLQPHSSKPQDEQQGSDAKINADLARLLKKTQQQERTLATLTNTILTQKTQQENKLSNDASVSIKAMAMASKRKETKQQADARKRAKPNKVRSTWLD